jgi:predicted RNA-binding protein with RPS1 domain
MSMGYRRVASEDGEAQPIRQKRKVKSRPEVRLAAEIAGVGYSMAYKVLRGKTQSEKVELALKMARERLWQQREEAREAVRRQREEARKAAREQLRELWAQEKQIVRAQRRLARALGRRQAA